MKLSIIIPIHNEEKNIYKLLTSIKKIKFKIPYEIIVVNDRSTDGTGTLLNKLKKRIKTLSIIHRTGDSDTIEIGYAITAGTKVAKGDMFTIMMGDLSDDPKDIAKMIKKINEGYDVVCGSRLIKGSRLINYPPLKLVMMKIYNNLFSFAFNLPVKDFSNAFKTYKRNVFKKVKLNSKEFEITAEMLIKAHIAGFKIAEVPVSWINRKSGKSKFGSFNLSFKFLFYQLPRIGFRYCATTIKLYFQYLFSKLR